jgi:predicted RNA-binding Zn-ribbon protein involved in translation (DUF1610 family)
MTMTKPFPQYESHCHGAPVEIHKGQKVKYYCTECGEPCIPRQKK